MNIKDFLKKHDTSSMDPIARRRHELKMKSGANKDTRSVHVMMSIKNNLENNVSGAVVHGIELA